PQPSSPHPPPPPPARTRPTPPTSAAGLRCHYRPTLLEAGSVPAGEIGERTGLTTGAVTRMVDRLERAGYVRREPDPTDRRRVIVSPVAERMATIAPMYAGMAQAWAGAMSGYDADQLAVIPALV